MCCASMVVFCDAKIMWPWNMKYLGQVDFFLGTHPPGAGTHLMKCLDLTMT